MKKTFLLVISLFFLSITQLSAMAPGGPKGLGMGPGGLPDMSDEDIEAFINVIENLPQDVKDELTKVGEDIIQRAEKLGKDPFELINEAAQKGQDVFEYTDKLIGDQAPAVEVKQEISTPIEKPVEIKPELKPEISETQVEQVEVLIENIIDALNSLRLKSIADRTKVEALIPFKFYIDDLIYYLEVIKDEALIKHLHAKEFEELLNNLKTLHADLVGKEVQLVIQEFSLEGYNPYEILGLPTTASTQEIVKAYEQRTKELEPNTKKRELKAQGKSDEEIQEILDGLRNEFEELSDAYQIIASKEQNEFLFNSILRAIKEANTSKNLIDDIQKLLKRYEPEALAIKKEQESLEQKAREEQKKMLETQFVFPAYEPRMPDRKRYEPARPDYASPFDYKPSAGLPSGPKSPDVSLPTPPTPSKPKKDDKKKDDGKKKEEPKKKKEEGKKEEGKKPEEAKKEKGPKLEEGDEKKVHDQMVLLKNSVKGLEKMIEKDDYESGKLFDHFQRFLGTGIPADQKAKEEYTKTYTADLKKRLDTIKAIGGKLKEIADFEKRALEKELEKSPAAQQVYAEKVREAFDAFEKSDSYRKYLEQVLKHLPAEAPTQVRMTPDTTAPINPDALFVFYGKKADGYTPDKALMELNPEIKKDDTSFHFNYIMELQNLYNKARAGGIEDKKSKRRK